MRKGFRVIILFLLSLSLLTSAGCKKQVIAARVNNEVITKQQLDYRVKIVISMYGESFPKGVEGKKLLQDLRKTVLNQMIDQLILLQAAKKEGIKVTNKEVEQKFKEIKGRFGSEKNYIQMLKAQHLTEQYIRQDIKKDLPVQKLAKKISDRVTVSAKEERAFFEANRSFFDKPERRRARHILTSSEAKAEEALGKIKNGADFSVVAKQYSEDADSRDKRGDLGFFSKGQHDSQFDNVVFSMQRGQISGIVRSNFGFHIIKLEDIKPETRVKFTEVKSEVRSMALKQKQQRVLNEYYRSLKKKAKITINKQVLKTDDK